MKVLKHGIYYVENETVKCSCGCKFEYENKDIVLESKYQLTSFPPQHRRFIVCPECHTQIFI